MKLVKITAGHYYVEVDGVRVGRVWSTRSSKARRVKGVGGVTHWVAATIPDEVVTHGNTYTRAHALEQLVEALS